MAARAQQPTQKSWPIFILAITLTVAAALAAAYFAGPLWVVPAIIGLAVATQLVPSPELTGKKDKAGRPTAADDYQDKQLRRSQMLRKVGTAPLLLGGKHLWPGKHVRLAWTFAIGVGLVTMSLPTQIDLPFWVAPASGVLAIGFIVGINGAYRTHKHPQDPHKGVGVADAIKHPATLWAALAGGVVAAGGTFYGFGYLVGWQDWRDYVGAVGMGITVASLVMWIMRQKDALQTHRNTVASRREWQGRWESMGLKALPTLVSREELPGGVVVERFDSGPEVGAARFVGRGGDEVRRVLGAGGFVGVLPDAAGVSRGQPDFGSFDPLTFRVVRFPDSSLPQLGEVEDDAVRELVLQTALSAGFDARQSPHPLVESVSPIGEGAYSVGLTAPEGMGWEMLRYDLAGGVAGMLGADVLVDHSSRELFVGELAGNESVKAESVSGAGQFGGSVATYFGALESTNEWRDRWANILKTPDHAPTPQFVVEKEAKLASGELIHYLPFVTRQGMTPDEFVGKEKEIATVLRAAPFVSVQSFPWGDVARGGKHPQAMVVVWSHDDVGASVDRMRPGNGDAETWVVGGRLTGAFADSRLPMPVVTHVSCLTTARSKRTGWKVSARLHATTLEEVRRKQTALATSLGVPWLRMTPGVEEGMVDFYFGGVPADMTLTNPDRDLPIISGLDWEEAWVAAKLVNEAGRTPRLVAVDHFEHNENVQILDFTLPASISVERVRANIAKLRTNTGNTFLEVSEGLGGPATMRVLASATDPMPTMADFDMGVVLHNALKEPWKVAFGTGVTGEPVIWDMSSDPHLKVLGATGSGKSVSMQAIGFANALAGHDLAIIDSIKGAADFKFLEPYSKAIARTPFEGAGVIDRVYEEVLRRKDLNQQYGVGSYLELPNEVRPKPFILMIDEFTSATKLDTVPKASSDMEMEAQRAELMALNEAKLKLGMLSGKIGREARSAGVFLVLGGQKLSAEDLAAVGARELKGQMATIFVGRPQSPGDFMSAMRGWENAPSLGEVVPKGRGLWESMTGSPELVQTWFNPGKQQFFTDHLQQQRQPLTDFWNLDSFTGPDERPPTVEDVVVELDAPAIEDLGTIRIDWDDVFDDSDGDGGEVMESAVKEIEAPHRHGAHAVVPAPPISLPAHDSGGFGPAVSEVGVSGPGGGRHVGVAGALGGAPATPVEGVDASVTGVDRVGVSEVPDAAERPSAAPLAPVGVESGGMVSGGGMSVADTVVDDAVSAEVVDVEVAEVVEADTAPVGDVAPVVADTAPASAGALVAPKPLIPKKVAPVGDVAPVVADVAPAKPRQIGPAPDLDVVEAELVDPDSLDETDAEDIPDILELEPVMEGDEGYDSDSGITIDLTQAVREALRNAPSPPPPPGPNAWVNPETFFPNGQMPVFDTGSVLILEERAVADPRFDWQTVGEMPCEIGVTGSHLAWRNMLGRDDVIHFDTPTVLTKFMVGRRRMATVGFTHPQPPVEALALPALDVPVVENFFWGVPVGSPHQ